MKRQYRIILFLFICLAAFTCLVVYARGGGGGGTGGGSAGGRGFNSGKLLILICWVIYIIITSFVLFFKRNKARSISNASNENIWHLENLEKTAELAFLQFQNAWMQKDLSAMKDIVTQKFFNEQTSNISILLGNEKINVLEHITISSISIITCRDFKDNSLDSFTANIKGSMVDYIISSETNNLISGSDNKSEKFTDSYTFLRYQNKWLLDEVTNDPLLGHYLNLKNFKEE